MLGTSYCMNIKTGTKVYPFLMFPQDFVEYKDKHANFRPLLFQYKPPVHTLSVPKQLLTWHLYQLLSSEYREPYTCNTQNQGSTLDQDSNEMMRIMLHSHMGQ